MKTILVVYGTRPEALKLAPLIKALRQNKKWKTIVLCTSQHIDMCKQVNNIFDLQPEIDFSRSSDFKPKPNLDQQLSQFIEQIGSWCRAYKPNLVIVQGDTTTATAGALAAAYQQIPVAHIEAGLRTKNMKSPYPEEMNRVIIDKVSTLHFAPTNISDWNLYYEGMLEENIHEVGNTIVDAFKSIKIRKSPVRLPKSPFILVTTHRRESFGKPLKEVYQTLNKIVDTLKIEAVVLVHPNPKVKEIIHKTVKSKKIHLIEPLDYQSFLYVMSKSKFIMSDSGGVQEEAALLHKPILILREVTERPEVVICGAGKLVGTNSTRIYEAAKELLTNSEVFKTMSSAKNPFGDGTTSIQIVKILTKWFSAKH